MLRFLGQFQADFQLKSGWIEPLLVGGYAPFSPICHFLRVIGGFFLSSTKVQNFYHIGDYIIVKNLNI